MFQYLPDAPSRAIMRVGGAARALDYMSITLTGLLTFGAHAQQGLQYM